MFSKNQGCYQTNEGIAEALYLSKATVQGGIKKLLKYGLITSEAYPNKAMRNKYYRMGKKPPKSGRTLKIVERKDWEVLQPFKKNEKLESQGLNAPFFYEKLDEDE